MPTIEPIPPGTLKSDDYLARYIAVEEIAHTAIADVCAILNSPLVPVFIVPETFGTPADALVSRSYPIFIYPDSPLWDRNLSIDDLPQIARVIMAHEVRHLYPENYTIRDSHQCELDADYFSGRVAFLLNLNRQVIIRFMSNLGGGVRSTHPSGQERVQHFIRGRDFQQQS